MRAKIRSLVERVCPVGIHPHFFRYRDRKATLIIDWAVTQNLEMRINSQMPSADIVQQVNECLQKRKKTR